MKVVIASDHGGYELKEILLKYVRELGHESLDYGTYSTERCDYTDFAFIAAEAVSNRVCDLAIIIDGAGVGSSIMANKLPGVRAAVANEIFTAENSRGHNDANVLCLGSFVIGVGVAKEIVKIWLKTLFSGDRNIRRVNKLVALENKVIESHDTSYHGRNGFQRNQILHQ